MFYDFLGSDPDNLTGSGSYQKVRIRPDPDPQHCLKSLLLLVQHSFHSLFLIFFLPSGTKTPDTDPKHCFKLKISPTGINSTHFGSKVVLKIYFDGRKMHRIFYLSYSAFGVGIPSLPWVGLHYSTMILQRIRIIVGDAGFEPEICAPEVWCTTN